MKITVINLKQIIKYIFIFFIIIISLVSLKGIFQAGDKKKQRISLIECLEYELPIMSSTYEGMQQAPKANWTTGILSSQLGVLTSIDKTPKTQEIEVIAPLEQEIPTEVSNNEEQKNEQIPLETIGSKETKAIEENNIKATQTDEWGGVKVNNQTNYNITEILQNATYSCSNNNQVLIYHTHTCESYTATEQYNYTMTDSYRTTDLNYTVSRVGDELGNQLEKYGFSIVHDKTYHDYPSYSGSYGRSLKTLQNMLSANNDAQIAIDLHRDAVGNMSNYAPSVQIGDEICAQVMFVVGTDGSGLAHENWRENLKFAAKVQQKANELYPGLFRPIILRNARYNQHLTTATTILEVGATGNTLEQCLASMKYVAEVLYQATR